MLSLLIISILLTTSFVGVAIWRMKALPESISSLVHILKHRWVWTLWMWAVGFLTCIPAITALDRIGMQFLGFGTLACLIFCAAMPTFMEDKKDVHDILGISACILSQGCVIFIDYNWLSVWMLFLFLMGSVYVQPDGELGKAMKGKGVFVAEMCCYVSHEGSLLMYYI